MSIDKLISRYGGCTGNEQRFTHIVQDYKGGGTTCGFLCHWLLWRLGCRNNRLVNRFEPLQNLRYTDGANISKIRGDSHFVTWSRMSSGARPSKGDIVFISNGTSLTEHVFIFLDEEQGLWKTWEAGGHGGKDDGARLGERRLLLTGGQPGLSDKYFGRRNVEGWLPIADVINVDDPPLSFDRDPFSSQLPEKLPDQGQRRVMGRWGVQSEGEQEWDYVFLGRGQVFYTQPKSTTAEGEGHWYSLNDKIAVRWDDTGNEEYFYRPLEFTDQEGFIVRTKRMLYANKRDPVLPPIGWSGKLTG